MTIKEIILKVASSNLAPTTKLELIKLICTDGKEAVLAIYFGSSIYDTKVMARTIYEEYFKSNIAD